jgi:hypothetical protein
MSALRSAGASLTPSPVIATVSPCPFSTSAIRSFVSGELREKTSSRPLSSTSASAASLIAAASAPCRGVAAGGTAVPARHRGVAAVACKTL